MSLYYRDEEYIEKVKIKQVRWKLKCDECGKIITVDDGHIPSISIYVNWNPEYPECDNYDSADVCSKACGDKWIDDWFRGSDKDEINIRISIVDEISVKLYFGNNYKVK